MKCPKCDKHITETKLQGIGSRNQHGTKLEALAYVCPQCDTIISVGLDPVLLANQIIEAVKK